jgi:hypothetical protein
LLDGSLLTGEGIRIDPIGHYSTVCREIHPSHEEGKYPSREEEIDGDELAHTIEP